MNLLTAIRTALPNRGVHFLATYDSQVWAKFTLNDSDDVFHVTDMWAFGAVAPDHAERFLLDRNADEEADDPGQPERSAPDLFTLLEGI